MTLLRLAFFASCAGAFMAFVACGEDQALVRERIDGGAVSEADGGGDAALACGAVLPATYESAGFATNAAVEIAFIGRMVRISDAIKATEGPADGGVTAADLKTIYNEGAPSLRAFSTPAAAATIDGYFDTVEAAVGKTWTPADAEQDGGAASGGKYGDYYFSPKGIHLRAGVEKTLLGGAVYNRVLSLVASPVTEATGDSLVAAFGTTPTVLDGREDAGDGNKGLAAYALDRDDKTSPVASQYRRIRAALLTMKGAIAGGSKCDADRDAAVATFLREWERTSFGTAIYFLSSAADTAADPQKGPQALSALSEAIGFIQGFKGLPAERRKITDAQIDTLLAKIGADTAYKLVTAPGDRALKLKEAINDIALYEELKPEEVEAFKKDF